MNALVGSRKEDMKEYCCIGSVQYSLGRRDYQQKKSFKKKETKHIWDFF